MPKDPETIRLLAEQAVVILNKYQRARDEGEAKAKEARERNERWHRELKEFVPKPKNVRPVSRRLGEITLVIDSVRQLVPLVESDREHASAALVIIEEVSKSMGRSLDAIREVLDNDGTGAVCDPDPLA